jgi:putative nucleotidyltransferase with HDIG domain
VISLIKGIERELEKIVMNITGPCSRRELEDLLKSTDKSFNDYRLEHTRRVVKLAKKLADELKADTDVVVLAAWLHDISKPGLSGVENHGNKSAEMADEILRDRGIDSLTIDRVKDTIIKHVGYTNDKQIEPIEAQILWEADKLDKLGLSGFIQGILNWAILDTGKTMIDIAKYQRDYMPLARKIVDSMFTEPAKRIAEERYDHLNQIYELLEYEIANHHGGEIN